MDVVVIAVPILVAVLAWSLNEYSKRQWERHKRKEDRYVSLLESLKGFYVSTEPVDAKEKKEEFIKQVELCWLYCPDAVIRSAYNFLDHVRVGAHQSDDKKEQALGALVLELRRDLLKEIPWRWKTTKFSSQDFRFFSGT